jgi:positive regulator of sigma E activity
MGPGGYVGITREAGWRAAARASSNGQDCSLSNVCCRSSLIKLDGRHAFAAPIARQLREGRLIRQMVQLQLHASLRMQAPTVPHVVPLLKAPNG